jgi:hypothetical protein
LTPLTVRPHHPLPLRMLEGVGRLTQGPQLSPESLLARAQRTTGLEDFGDDAFREPLDRLLRDLLRAGPTFVGRLVLAATYTAAAQQRLRVVAALSADPQIAARPIPAPVFIVGFHRTGTTLLQHLLASDPAFRSFRFCELVSPEAPSMLRARVSLAATRLVSPELSSIHPISPGSPEECWALFLPTFAVKGYDLHGELPSYAEWFASADLSAPYRFYASQLQLLLGPGSPGGRPLLKCAEHLWSLGALFQTFPDARVLWPHREPSTCIASYASLSALFRRSVFGRFDPHAIGRHLLARFSEGLERALAVRARLGEDHFVDVAYTDVFERPLQTAQRLYERLGMTWSPAVEGHLSRWLERQGRWRGRPHRYSLDAFGLRREEVDERFSDYRARFVSYLEVR